VLHHWCHLGTAKSDDELTDILREAGAPRFDLDTFKILQRFLAEPASRRAVVELAA
jgi:DNA polymerase-3 subunit epsilon